MSDWKNVQYRDGKMRTSSGGGGTTHQIYETTFSWKRGSSSSTEKSMEYTATQDGWVFARCYIANSSNSYCAIEGYIYDTNAQIIKFMDMDTGIQAYHTWKVAFPVKKGDVIQINTRLDSGTLQSDGIFRFMG